MAKVLAATPGSAIIKIEKIKNQGDTEIIGAKIHAVMKLSVSNTLLMS